MEHAATQAGAFMLDSNDHEQTDTLNRKDFVTITDIKSQNILRDQDLLV